MKYERSSKWLRHSFNVTRSLKKGRSGRWRPEHSGVLNNVLKGDKVWNKSWAQLGNVISAHVRVKARLRGGRRGPDRVSHRW